MKVYSIGREAGCDIVIHDSTDVISRRHAVLNVSPSGKMTITDMSHNGTYVNGIRISPNVPVPVTRKDSVSLAHVARLDWNRVPKAGGSIIAYVVGGVAALLLLIALAVGAYFLFSGSGDTTTTEPPVYGSPEPVPVVKTDSDSINKTNKEKADDLMKEEKRKQDSIRNAIRQHIEDSIKNASKPAPRPHNDGGKKDKDNNAGKPADKPKTDNDTKTTKTTETKPETNGEPGNRVRGI